MLTAALTWFSIYWTPVVGALVLAVLFWSIHRSVNDPDFIAMREKAAYDEAHAYLKGKCCCGRNKTED